MVFLFYRIFQELELKAADIRQSIFPALYACAPLLIIIWLNNLLTLSPTFVNVAAALTLYSLLWAIGTWYFGINSGERAQLLGLLRKALHRA